MQTGQSRITKIAVWGDSILQGVVTGKSGRIFDVLDDSSLALASKKLGFELINKSIYGNIITKARRVMERDLQKGLACDVGIIEGGGNDCDYDWASVSENPDAPHEPKVPLVDFLRALEEMVAALRTHKITPLLMTMPPLIAPNWYKTICKNQNEANINKFINGDVFTLYRNHELYSINIAKFAVERGVQFVDMRLALLGAADFPALMCEDGIHPNEQGHAFMADIWERELPNVRKE